jgi:hypothetical protein
VCVSLFGNNRDDDDDDDDDDNDDEYVADVDDVSNILRALQKYVLLRYMWLIQLQ